MVCNSKITIYHQNGLDENTHFETWKRYNYENVWFKASYDSKLDTGYSDNNSFNCRIGYDENPNLNINNFSQGDIIVEGHLTLDITSQTELNDYKIFNITSIKDNNFGEAKHIHLGGK
ncbi:MAG: DUF6751 family protein [Methanosphaera sp.]|nr:DUF6751 family protein [Methanosphaera sp.]